MRFSTGIAFVMAFALFFFAAFMSAKNPMIYLNLHATLVVFGGTFAAAAISFGFGRLLALKSVFVRRVVKGKTNFDPRVLIQELMVIAEAYRTNSPLLSDMIARTADPFLKESMQGVMEGLFPKEDLIRVLTVRTMSIYGRYYEEAMKFKALAKFPPAFGLMGAVMGMVGIMNELGSAGGNQEAVGPALALALVGTLYGVALANLVILPLAENLMDGAREVKAKNLIITEGIGLIIDKKNPVVLAEELNSFLLASERFDWKKTREILKKAA